MEDQFINIAKRFSALMQYLEIVRMEYGKRVAEKCVSCSRLTSNLVYYSRKSNPEEHGQGYYCEVCWQRAKSSWWPDNEILDWETGEYKKELPQYIIEINEELFGENR